MSAAPVVSEEKAAGSMQDVLLCNTYVVLGSCALIWEYKFMPFLWLTQNILNDYDRSNSCSIIQVPDLAVS